MCTMLIHHYRHYDLEFVAVVVVGDGGGDGVNRVFVHASVNENHENVKKWERCWR
jgi:hypothetical protein